MLNNEDYNLEPIMSIGTVASRLNIHQRTLRIYDKEGIVSPKRSDKNRRFYSVEDYERLKVIRYLTTNLTMNLVSVKILLSILEDNNIQTKEMIDYINNLAKKINITPEIQKENIKKNKSKGRKKKEQDNNSLKKKLMKAVEEELRKRKGQGG